MLLNNNVKLFALSVKMFDMHIVCNIKTEYKNILTAWIRREQLKLLYSGD